jgi:hypothetical protein
MLVKTQYFVQYSFEHPTRVTVRGQCEDSGISLDSADLSWRAADGTSLGGGETDEMRSLWQDQNSYFYSRLQQTLSLGLAV